MLLSKQDPKPIYSLPVEP